MRTPSALPSMRAARSNFCRSSSDMRTSWTDGSATSSSQVSVVETLSWLGEVGVTGCATGLGGGEVPESEAVSILLPFEGLGHEFSGVTFFTTGRLTKKPLQKRLVNLMANSQQNARTIGSHQACHKAPRSPSAPPTSTTTVGGVGPARPDNNHGPHQWRPSTCSSAGEADFSECRRAGKNAPAVAIDAAKMPFTTMWHTTFWLVAKSGDSNARLAQPVNSCRVSS
mmetsp:Transcript_84418/g.235505  ORF Transcript_84418/g.235505 Transcript_84418/m.235505 type:complete len:226 (+) Transcript_84418:920-1597(+)